MPLATYGPPYNNTPGASQQLGPISLERAFGVEDPDRHCQGFVLHPLSTLPDQPAVQAALSQYQGASAAQQAKWDAAYEKVVTNATFSNGQLTVKSGPYGPVGVLIANLVTMARSGALDGALLASPQEYATNYTNPLLIVADGSYMRIWPPNSHLQGATSGG